MKPSYEELEQKLAESQREFRAADATIENLQMQVEKLAAENARYSMSAGQADQRMAESCAVREALGFNQDADDVSPSDLVDKIKSIIAEYDAIRSVHPQPLGPVMDSAIDAFNAEEMPETGMLNAYFILRDSITVKTTQVDAFLDEVRASGVEMFADQKNNEMMSLHPDTHAVGSIAAAMSAEVKELREFAAQLRKGVQS